MVREKRIGVAPRLPCSTAPFNYPRLAARPPFSSNWKLTIRETPKFLPCYCRDIISPTYKLYASLSQTATILYVTKSPDKGQEDDISASFCSPELSVAWKLPQLHHRSPLGGHSSNHTPKRQRAGAPRTSCFQPHAKSSPAVCPFLHAKKPPSLIWRLAHSREQGTAKSPSLLNS